MQIYNLSQLKSAAIQVGHYVNNDIICYPNVTAQHITSFRVVFPEGQAFTEGDMFPVEEFQYFVYSPPIGWSSENGPPGTDCIAGWLGPLFTEYYTISPSGHLWSNSFEADTWISGGDENVARSMNPFSGIPVNCSVEVERFLDGTTTASVSMTIFV